MIYHFIFLLTFLLLLLQLVFLHLLLLLLLPVKVRKARNRRQEWNLMAYDKELRPDARVTPSPYHTSDGSMSPDRWVYLNTDSQTRQTGT